MTPDEEWAERVAYGAMERGALQKEEELRDFLLYLRPLEDWLSSRVILEVGSFHGGTLWAWAQLRSAGVISVDIDHAQLRDAYGATLITGDSHDQATLACVSQALNGAKVGLLFIDAAHSYEDVRQDWLMYSPLVASGGVAALHDVCHVQGGVVAFHDICYLAGQPYHGVKQLWEEIGQDGVKIAHFPFNWGGIGILRR